MNTSALIFMIVAQVTVITITVYFFVKSLKAGSKDQKQKHQKE